VLAHRSCGPVPRGDRLWATERCWRSCGASRTSCDGFELSEPAAELARRAVPEARRIESYDGEHVPAEDGRVRPGDPLARARARADPAPLLNEAARVAHEIIVEVPLEDNRSPSARRSGPSAARIGHLHAFDRAAVRELLSASGLVLEEELTDPSPTRITPSSPRGRRRVRAAAKWASPATHR
jgi:hypothetical protein